VSVGFQSDGDGLGLVDGSSSDHVSVGCAGRESGAGVTVGTTSTGCTGEASGGVDAGLSSPRRVALGAPGEGLGVAGRAAASVTSSDSSSTSTGWVGWTNINVDFFDGVAAPELVPVGVGPPISAAAGMDTSTRVPLAYAIAIAAQSTATVPVTGPAHAPIRRVSTR
jgi:hypothetical protein